MASIRQRSGKWQARVIRLGFPPEAKSFNTHSEAQRWARQIESAMDRGAYQAAAGANQVLLRDILQRYMVEASPTKRGYAEEVSRIKALQRARMAAYSMSRLSAGIVADFRDARLNLVGASAVTTPSSGKVG